MNGLRIDYLENLSNLCLYRFRSVVPCDMINDLKVGDQFICNLDTSHEKGSHFVALSVKKGEVLYVDPYGLPCINKYIQSSFSKYGINKIYYSKKPIQSSLSLFCGYFCLAFLICDERGMSLKEFLTLFKAHDVQANEKIAAKLIKRAIIDRYR